MISLSTAKNPSTPQITTWPASGTKKISDESQMYSMILVTLYMKAHIRKSQLFQAQWVLKSGVYQ